LIVTDDHDLRDKSVGANLILQLRWSDILAACSDQNLLLTTGDGQVTILIQMADIAGVEPAVNEFFCGLVGQIQITFEDTDPAGQNLPIVCNADATPRSGKSHGADTRLAWTIHRDWGCCFGQTITFFNVDPNAAEEMA